MNDVEQHKIKILLIGSLPPPIGGTTVLFKQLLDELSNHEALAVAVINTSGIRGSGLMGFIRLMKLILAGAFRTDIISLHCATPALPYFGIIVLAIARLAHKKLIVRKFAGTDYGSLGRIRGRLSEFVLRRSDLCLMETKRLVRLANLNGIRRVKWFPNNRPASPPGPEPEIKKEHCRNFVFIGQINKVKGILEIMEIDRRLPDRILIDLFGPFEDGLSEESFRHCRHVHYKGILNPEQVIFTLRRYDALLLPTYHPGEGYPGVINEAYAAGIPVITTQWLDIPELVDQSSGVLIPPEQPQALLDAILELSSNLERYTELCDGARKKSLAFSSHIWTDEFIRYCRDVIYQR